MLESSQSTGNLDYPQIQVCIAKSSWAIKKLLLVHSTQDEIEKDCFSEQSFLMPKTARYSGFYRRNAQDAEIVRIRAKTNDLGNPWVEN